MNRTELSELWRMEADVMRRRGQMVAATTCEVHALELLELERTPEAPAGGTLTVSQAAALSGFSPGYIRRRLGEGKIPNVGVPFHPRIRAEDVPKRIRNRGRPKQRLVHHDPQSGILSLFGTERSAGDRN